MSIVDNVYNEILSILPTNQFGRLQTRTLSLINSIEDDLKGTVIPTLENILNSKEVFKQIESTTTFKNVIKSNTKVKTFEEFVNICKRYSDDVLLNIDKLEKQCNKLLTNSLNNKTITYRQYAFFTSVEDIKSNLTYMLRIIYFVIRDEKESVMSNAHMASLRSNLFVFKDKVLESRLDIAEIFKEINELSNDPVYDRVTLDAPDTVKDNGINIKGFMGNPIYTFRKWKVNNDIEKLSALEETKALLELRILELKNDNAGVDPNSDEAIKLAKQIEWYEDKVATTIKKINKIEAKAN